MRKQTHKPPQPTTTFDQPEAMTDGDLHMLAWFLHDRMRVTLSSADPDRFRFNGFVKAIRDSNGDAGVAEREDLEAAMEFWNTIPAEKRQQILGGWNPESLAILNRANCDSGDTVLCPVLELDDSGLSQFAAEFDDDYRAVRVQIGVGTSKADALAGLDKIHKMIDAEWDALIRSPSPWAPGQKATESAA
jgi:hypothetical protein